MKRFLALCRQAGLGILLAAALGFVANEDLRDATHLRQLAALGATDAAGAGIQPPGDTRNVVLPLASMDAHWWILHTEQLLAEGRPVRHTARDNPPAGREVHWSSALTLALAGLAGIIRLVSGQPLHDSVQTAAVWIGPLFLALVLPALFLLVRRRFGFATAACLILCLATSAPFLSAFAVGEADHHGLAVTFSLLAVWLLVAAGAGRVGAAPGETDLASPQAVRRARRGFAAAGIAGAAALWISAFTAIPVLVAIAGGALLGACLTGRARSPRSQAHPELWSLWGAWGAGASLVFYALEYLPAHAGLRLEVNHPLHALAWWGGAGWLARILRRMAGGAWFAGRTDRLLATLQAPASLAPLILIGLGGTRFFVLNDPFLRALHHDYIQEFRNLPDCLAETGWGLLPLLWLVLFPAAWLLWRARRRAPETASPLALAFVAALTAVALTCLQIRWQSLAAALLAVLVSSLFIGTRDPSLSGGWRRFRFGLGLLVAGGLLQHPALLLWARSHRNPAGPPVDRMECASLVVRDVAWALQPRPGEPPPVILSGPTTSTQLAYFGGFRVLGTLYWENLDGLKTAAAIFGATDPEQSLRLCMQHGVTHLVMFSWDDFGAAYSRLYRGVAAGDGETAASHLLSDQRIPRWLRPLAYSIPPALGLAGQFVRVYEIHPEQDAAEAYFHLGRYLLEIGRTGESLVALQRCQDLLNAAGKTAPPALVLSVADHLRAAGGDRAAARLLRVNLARTPHDRDLLWRLILIDTTSTDPAARYDPEVHSLAEKLFACPPPFSWEEVEALVRGHDAGNRNLAVNLARGALGRARQENLPEKIQLFEGLLDGLGATRWRFR